MVTEQLKQERQGTSERAQKLQHRLKEMQQERDTALKQMADSKLKLTEAKESSRKEVADLQEKLVEVMSTFNRANETHSQSVFVIIAAVVVVVGIFKMSKEASSKVSEVQCQLQEVRKQYTEALDKVTAAENAKRKSEFGLQKLQV